MYHSDSIYFLISEKNYFHFHIYAPMLKLCPVVAAILDFNSTPKNTLCKRPRKSYWRQICTEMVQLHQITIILKYFQCLLCYICNVMTAILDLIAKWTYSVFLNIFRGRKKIQYTKSGSIRSFVYLWVYFTVTWWPFK